MVVKLETTGRRLFLLPVCLPIDPELLSFMKKRSDLEKSSLNLETWRRLFLLPVCLPIDPELLSFMKKRSDLEKSSPNLETWIRFSNLRCRLHLPVPTLDFKQ